MLSNISRRKGNQTIKFAQIIEYSMDIAWTLYKTFLKKQKKAWN